MLSTNPQSNPIANQKSNKLAHKKFLNDIKEIRHLKDIKGSIKSKSDKIIAIDSHSNSTKDHQEVSSTKTLEISEQVHVEDSRYSKQIDIIIKKLAKYQQSIDTLDVNSPDFIQFRQFVYYINNLKRTEESSKYDVVKEEYSHRPFSVDDVSRCSENSRIVLPKISLSRTFHLSTSNKSSSSTRSANTSTIQHSLSNKKPQYKLQRFGGV